MSGQVAPERIGIAIATHQSGAVIGGCLSGLASSSFTIVVFDDASLDDTVSRARASYPDVVVLRGDGNNWWAGGTRSAVEECLRRGCDYVVMLNPDVRITTEQVHTLVAHTAAHAGVIAAALVVDAAAPDRVAWAGSRFGPLAPCVPVYTSRYVLKRGAPVQALGTTPYAVDEAHGRGVVVSRDVIARIGMLDASTFPHYGADTDYSFRARAAGVQIHVLPSVRVTLETERTGMAAARGGALQRLRQVRAFLLERKNGEAARVWWHLLRRHVPRHALLPSYAFNISLNVARRLT